MNELSAFFLATMMIAGCARPEPPANPPESAAVRPASPPMAVPTFDGDRAFDVLKRQVDFGPRNPGSAGHAACLEYLAATLRGCGADVRLQNFEATGYDQERLHLTNVVASFRPEAANRVLLCAHWDTRPRAEHDEDKSRRSEPILGANDGASGVAVLLEIGRLLKDTPPPVGVDLVLFDGEDYGKEGDLSRYLLGSQHFADTKAPDYVPRFGILLDMVGDTFLDLPKEKSSMAYAPDIVDLVWSTAQSLGVTQFLQESGEEVFDDHVPLNRVGIKTIDIIDFNYPDPTNRYWHTHQDTPEHCSAGSLLAVGTVLTHVVYTQTP